MRCLRQPGLVKTLGAHGTRPAQRHQRSQDTAASRLGGVHKHDALYSARREPRARAQTWGDLFIASRTSPAMTLRCLFLAVCQRERTPWPNLCTHPFQPRWEMVGLVYERVSPQSCSAHRTPRHDTKTRKVPI